MAEIKTGAISEEVKVVVKSPPGMSWLQVVSREPKQYPILLLKRVINVKFLLLPHQKHNITQYEELNLAFYILLR